MTIDKSQNKVFNNTYIIMIIIIIKNILFNGIHLKQQFYLVTIIAWFYRYSLFKCIVVTCYHYRYTNKTILQY